MTECFPRKFAKPELLKWSNRVLPARRTGFANFGAEHSGDSSNERCGSE
jgi:hypothetical protein